MPRTKLDNYLRAYRRRSGLSQDEVAYLLGTRSGTKISRYERGGRLPDLDTALAFKAIFHLPVGVLFAGRQQKVERSVLRRAAKLQQRLETEGPKKLRALAAIRQLSGRGPNLDQ